MVHDLFVARHDLLHRYHKEQDARNHSEHLEVARVEEGVVEPGDGERFDDEIDVDERDVAGNGEVFVEQAHKFAQGGKYHKQQDDLFVGSQRTVTVDADDQWNDRKVSRAVT